MRIYLAGFDVFRPDSVEQGRKMKELCAQYGFEGCYPLDNEADTAQEIYEANVALLASCDVVAANCNPFRGQEMDSGTAFEVGYGCALGKKVYGYLADGRPMVEKLGKVDDQGFHVENFGQPLNLMIAIGATVVTGGLEECLQKIQADVARNCDL
jgi:nucleoside 2-deoxyribosyltransferase